MKKLDRIIGCFGLTICLWGCFLLPTPCEAQSIDSILSSISNNSRGGTVFIKPCSQGFNAWSLGVGFDLRTSNCPISKGLFPEIFQFSPSTEILDPVAMLDWETNQSSSMLETFKNLEVYGEWSGASMNAESKWSNLQRETRNQQSYFLSQEIHRLLVSCKT